jgi:hypothetical protein
MIELTEAELTVSAVFWPRTERHSQRPRASDRSLIKSGKRGNEFRNNKNALNSVAK